MGEIANAVLDHGGEVIGIIPEFLVNREHANARGDLIVTRDMHERKQHDVRARPTPSSRCRAASARWKSWSSR